MFLELLEWSHEPCIQKEKVSHVLGLGKGEAKAVEGRESLPSICGVAIVTCRVVRCAPLRFHMRHGGSVSPQHDEVIQIIQDYCERRQR